MKRSHTGLYLSRFGALASSSSPLANPQLFSNQKSLSQQLASLQNAVANSSNGLLKSGGQRSTNHHSIISGLSGTNHLYATGSFKNEISIEPNYQQQANNLQQRLNNLTKLRSCNGAQLNGQQLNDGGLQTLASSISPTLQPTTSPQLQQFLGLTTLNGGHLNNGTLPSNPLTPAPSPQDNQPCTVLDVLNCSANAGLGNSSNSSSSAGTNNSANLLGSSNSGLGNSLTNNVMSAIAAIAAASQSNSTSANSPTSSSQLLQDALNSLANGGHLRESSSKAKSEFDSFEIGLNCGSNCTDCRNS